MRKGRVDAVVQSTDKNFMVPVGGAIVAAPKSRPALVAAVNANYPGRASMSAHLDLLVTLLYWGAEGWRARLQVGGQLGVLLASCFAPYVVSDRPRKGSTYTLFCLCYWHQGRTAVAYRLRQCELSTCQPVCSWATHARYRPNV